MFGVGFFGLGLIGGGVTIEPFFAFDAVEGYGL